MGLSKFEELEERVNQLLNGCESLTGERRELRDLLKGKDAEIRGLKHKLKRLDGEKGKVRDKLDSLLTRLNGLIQKA